MDKLRTFFVKIRAYFLIFKKGQWKPAPFSLPPSPCPLSPSFTPTSMDKHEHASISVIIPKYLWKCLHNVQTMPGLWRCLVILHVRSYMYGKLLRIPQDLNVSEFWIWDGYICKGYTELWIRLNLTQYALTVPKCASICLNVTHYSWTWFNIAECP